MHGSSIWIINPQCIFKFNNCSDFIAFKIFTSRRNNRRNKPERKLKRNNKKTYIKELYVTNKMVKYSDKVLTVS